MFYKIFKNTVFIEHCWRLPLEILKKKRKKIVISVTDSNSFDIFCCAYRIVRETVLHFSPKEFLYFDFGTFTKIKNLWKSACELKTLENCSVVRNTTYPVSRDSTKTCSLFFFQDSITVEKL